MSTITNNATFTITKTWILAGKAIFTVHNGKGTHYTYRVSMVENDGRDPVFFVSNLAGPNNEEDYIYMGMLNPKTGIVRPTAKSNYMDKTPQFKVLNWALGKVWSGKSFPDGYGINGEGKCGRCGRTLTAPDGIDEAGYRLGYGPVCYEKMIEERGVSASGFVPFSYGNGYHEGEQGTGIDTVLAGSPA